MALSVYARLGQSQVGGTQQVLRQHVVVGNDTLPMIAARYAPELGYSSEYWRQIAEFNSIFDLDALTTGTVLVIPTPQPQGT